jgi:hypothetical protein
MYDLLENNSCLYLTFHNFEYAYFSTKCADLHLLCGLQNSVQSCQKVSKSNIILNIKIFIFLAIFVRSFHSIGMCRMQRLLAVLRSFFHTSLLYTFPKGRSVPMGHPGQR